MRISAAQRGPAVQVLQDVVRIYDPGKIDEDVARVCSEHPVQVPRQIGDQDPAADAGMAPDEGRAGEDLEGLEQLRQIDRALRLGVDGDRRDIVVDADWDAVLTGEVVDAHQRR